MATVTADTLTDEQIDAYQRAIVRSGTSSAAVDAAVRLCNWARSDFPSRRMREEARAQLAAAINDLHAASPVTGYGDHPVTDEQIRDYVREHWRDAWMGGGPGKGTVNDAAIILVSPTTPHEWKLRIRCEFTRLIAAADHNARHAGKET